MVIHLYSGMMWKCSSILYWALARKLVLLYSSSAIYLIHYFFLVHLCVGNSIFQIYWKCFSCHEAQKMMADIYHLLVNFSQSQLNCILCSRM